jgi:4-amino-4-deoxy-L-arabinose transferase-like glycosyltransferase
MHNARNLALFGQVQSDDFQNRLIMPTLHSLQVGIFSVFPPTLLPLRLFTVLCGILTLYLLYSALRRAFSTEVALFGVLFLAFDPVPLLYNRMALMDTPAALLLVGGFYAFVRAEQYGGRKWYALCGLLLGTAFTVRGLVLVFFPIPLLLLWRRREAVHWVGGGMGCVLLLYLVFWWLPHRTEIAHANGFYLRDQILPHSLTHFGSILITSLLGDDRGISPFLLRHSPLLFVGSLLAVGYWVWQGRQEKWESLSKKSILYLGYWFLLGVLLCSVIGYAPSRYYILFYPAMCGVVGWLCVRWERVLTQWAKHPVACALLGAYCGFHLVLTFRPHHLGGYVGVGVGAVLGLLLAKPVLLRFSRLKPMGLVCFFALFSGYWLQDWLLHLRYTRQEVQGWIEQNIPQQSVLLGDVASGVAIDTRHRLVPVIKDLCNDKDPVGRFSDRPCYILVMEGEYRQKWWFQHYPHLLIPENRVAYFPRVVKYPVGIYRVPPKP